jgi:hypothetical protein
MLSVGVLAVSLFTTTVKSQNAATVPPGLTALLDRAAIEDLLVDYYAQIGTDNHDFSNYFTADGRLEVNGLIATGKAEIIALYDRAGGGIDETTSSNDNKVPPGRFNMVLSNLKVMVQGDTATATMLWYSIVSPTLIAPPGVTEHGHDRTELTRQNGRWLISKRTVTSDGGMPEGLLQYYPGR